MPKIIVVTAAVAILLAVSHGTLSVGPGTEVTDITTCAALQFESFPGTRYAIYWSEDMTSWSLAETVVATEYTTTWVDSGDTDRSPYNSTGVKMRFYKIEIEQN